jgi:hypothetical protein
MSTDVKRSSSIQKERWSPRSLKNKLKGLKALNEDSKHKRGGYDSFNAIKTEGIEDITPISRKSG